MIVNKDQRNIEEYLESNDLSIAKSDEYTSNKLGKVSIDSLTIVRFKHDFELRKSIVVKEGTLALASICFNNTFGCILSFYFFDNKYETVTLYYDNNKVVAHGVNIEDVLEKPSDDVCELYSGYTDIVHKRNIEESKLPQKFAIIVIVSFSLLLIYAVICLSLHGLTDEVMTRTLIASLIMLIGTIASAVILGDIDNTSIGRKLNKRADEILKKIISYDCK